MEQKDIFKYSIIFLATILFYLSYLTIKPFLMTIIITIILTFVCYPIYKLLLKYVKKEWIASIITITLILLLFIIPTSLLITKLITESATAYRTINDIDIKSIPYLDKAPETILIQIQDILDGISGFIKDFIVNYAPNVISEIAKILLLLFISIFIMFYMFIYGNDWFNKFKKRTPLNPKLKQLLFDDIEKITKGIIYGQILTALIQGSVGGLMFFIFGIPNPVFWGFIMILFSFLPMLGTPIIFVPAGLIALAQKHYVAGIGVLVVGLLIVMNIDNFIRPYLVSSRTNLHPILVIIGVLGGMKAFGFSGFIIGPLVLGLTITLLKDYFTHPNIIDKN